MNNKIEYNKIKYNKTNRITIFDTINRPIIVVDSQCRILDTNQAVIEWANRPRASMIGHTCYQMATGSDKPCWESADVTCPIKLAIESKRVTRLIHEKKFGIRSVKEEVLATPVFGDDNKIDYIILELNDISELVNTKEAITYLKDEVTSLKKIIPICASCKKIRDDEGFWQHVENYLGTRMETQFSHSMCPQCMEEKHPEICDIDPAICSDENK